MRAVYLIPLLALPGTALAEAPRVVTSIKPLFDLTSMLMTGVGKPELLLRDNESVHHASLRPSQMRDLADADLVISIGNNLEPWLAKAEEAINPDAIHLVMSEQPGLTLIPYRQPATVAAMSDQEEASDDPNPEPEMEQDSDFFFPEDDTLEAEMEEMADAHEDAAQALAELEIGDENEEGDHAHEEDGHEEEGHDEHEEEGHEGEGEHDHDTSGADPHIWLDPDNMLVFIDAIARSLAVIDPDNAEIYLGNAEASKIEMGEAVLQARDVLVNLTDTRMVYNHDSYQYFEAAFGLKSLGFTSTFDARQVGARTIADLEAKVEFAPEICVVVDPSESAKSVSALFPGERTVTIDTFGFNLDTNDPYPASFVTALARGFADCG